MKASEHVFHHSNRIPDPHLALHHSTRPGLAEADSDALKSLEPKGVRLLLCITCLICCNLTDIIRAQRLASNVIALQAAV